MKTFDCKHGEITVSNVMFDIDDTNLVEGIEIEGEDIGVIQIYEYYDVDELDIETVENLIDENL